jgi:hypothetical protein
MFLKYSISKIRHWQKHWKKPEIGREAIGSFINQIKTPQHTDLYTISSPKNYVVDVLKITTVYTYMDLYA